MTENVLVNYTSKDPFDGIVLLTVRTESNATAQDQTSLVLEGPPTPPPTPPPTGCEFPFLGSIPFIGSFLSRLFAWLFCRSK